MQAKSLCASGTRGELSRMAGQRGRGELWLSTMICARDCAIVMPEAKEVVAHVDPAERYLSATV